MEFLIGAVAIIALAVIFGADLAAVYFIVMLAMAAVMLFIVGFFVVCLIWLAGSEKCRGRFIKLDKNPRYRYRSAFYSVTSGENETEYPNIFPCELILKKYIYRSDKMCRLYVNKKHGFVFDPNAFACVFTGIVLGSASAVMMTYIIVTMSGLGFFNV